MLEIFICNICHKILYRNVNNIVYYFHRKMFSVSDAKNLALEQIRSRQRTFDNKKK